MGTFLGQLIAHPDSVIISLFQNYGVWIYTLMFIEFFLESALVFASFLPRDGILFMIGALSLDVVGDDIPGKIDLDAVLKTIIVAGILGDITSYLFGKYVGQSIIDKKFTIFSHSFCIVQSQHIQKAKKFIDSYGYKAFTYSRLLPFFRNIVPFVAGIIKSDMSKFILFDSIGVIILISGEILLGVLFGNIPAVKNNISIITIIIICLIVFGPILGKKLMVLLKRKTP